MRESILPEYNDDDQFVRVTEEEYRQAERINNTAREFNEKLELIEEGVVDKNLTTPLIKPKHIRYGDMSIVRKYNKCDHITELIDDIESFEKVHGDFLKKLGSGVLSYWRGVVDKLRIYLASVDPEELKEAKREGLNFYIIGGEDKSETDILNILESTQKKESGLSDLIDKELIQKLRSFIEKGDHNEFYATLLVNNIKFVKK
ncbi:hypothetical protein H6775_03215 [Candidatus Nomurabacteria bacterium]|nr:hypothetical protein [Candidatus Nomurabacteria bacterium]